MKQETDHIERNDMSKYTLGIDYGTLSARTVLMNCEDGSVAASSTKAYPHAVMDRQLPDGTPLRNAPLRI